jgi:peptidoglycan/LPS O-acetylase OafA/YrhL
VDLHEKRQLDLAEHMAKVNQHVAKAKAHARPWRAIIATVLAIIAGAVASQAGQGFKDWTGHGNYVYKIVAAACIAAFFIFGTIAVLGLAGKRGTYSLPPLARRTPPWSGTPYSSSAG